MTEHVRASLARKGTQYLIIDDINTMPEKRWVLEPLPDAAAIAELAKDLKINEHHIVLLLQKGITTFDEAKQYFRPSLTMLHDPFAMKDMDKAVYRLMRAINNQEKILIYGDYDVDGVTSVTLAYEFLKTYCPTLQYYVPDRSKEGYGLSMQAIEWSIEEGFSLIITLDCGIKSLLPLAKAAAAGIDVIVCDHHEPDLQLPKAYAILNPKQPACTYPYKELSGCGIGFKLLQALAIQQGAPLTHLYNYLGLVAISIACDLVPLTGENRILAYHGLQQLNHSPSVGLQALIQTAKLVRPIEINDLVFIMGPRINAAGRVEHAHLAIELLIEKNLDRALVLAQKLEQSNTHRRTLDQKITAEALALIAENTQPTYTTVLFKEDWHKGVVGIVASRCIEQYYRPTVILTGHGEKATGSARSVAGYNVYEAISACEDLLDHYGGHAYAAGLTLSLKNIAAFQQRFESFVASTLPPDAKVPTQIINLTISLDQLSEKFYRILHQMAPFGNGNRRPIFVSQPLVAKWVEVLKNAHLKLQVRQEGQVTYLDAIGYGLASYGPFLKNGQPFKMAYAVEQNTYWKEPVLQLVIKGIEPL